MDKQVKDTTVFTEHKEQGQQAVKNGWKTRKQTTGFQTNKFDGRSFPTSWSVNEAVKNFSHKLPKKLSVKYLKVPNQNKKSSQASTEEIFFFICCNSKKREVTMFFNNKPAIKN